MTDLWAAPAEGPCSFRYVTSNPSLDRQAGVSTKSPSDVVLIVSCALTSRWSLQLVSGRPPTLHVANPSIENSRPWSSRRAQR